MKSIQVDPNKQVVPCQLGLDFVRMATPRFKISFRQLKFPAEFAKQEMKKITLNIKLYQFSGNNSFECTSQCFHLKDVRTGMIYCKDA